MKTIESALEELPPIERNTLGQQVYRDLRNLIMSGHLAPGDQLSLRSVAQALGVSMMPVRDAVNRLIVEQALVATPNRAVRVPTATAESFNELATIRIEIEGFAAEMAATNRSNADIAAIAAAEKAYRTECLAQQPDLTRAMALNMAFHFEVYRASKLPRLVEIVESLWLRAGPLIILETRNNPDRLISGRSYDRHAEALQAIKVGDGAAAREALAADIRKARDFILSSSTFLAPP